MHSFRGGACQNCRADGNFFHLTDCPGAMPDREHMYSASRRIIDFCGGTWVMRDNGAFFGVAAVLGPLGPGVDDGDGYEPILVWPNADYPVRCLTLVFEQRQEAIDYGTKFAVWLKELHAMFGALDGPRPMNEPMLRHLAKLFDAGESVKAVARMLRPC